MNRSPEAASYEPLKNCPQLEGVEGIVKDIANGPHGVWGNAQVRELAGVEFKAQQRGSNYKGVKENNENREKELKTEVKKRGIGKEVKRQRE